MTRFRYASLLNLKVYVIGFVEPITGLWVSYLVPALNGDWYSAVLQLLAQHFCGEPIKLVVDQAGWHTGEVIQIPENISLEFLPPHSPELNPVEQMWDDVRYHYTRNETFTESEVLWDTLSQAMRDYSANPQKVKSITNQEWLYGKKQA